MKYSVTPTAYDEKYRSDNKLIQLVNNRFFQSLHNLINIQKSDLILDAGCGEGVVAVSVLRTTDVEVNQLNCLDNDFERMCIARDLLPGVQFHHADMYHIPFQDNSFELVLALQVLEHLDDPGLALKELCRVSGSKVLLSVPNDHMFKFGNMLRGKHLSTRGRTPTHIHGWNKRSFTRFISTYLEIEKVRTPLNLWILCLGTKKS